MFGIDDIITNAVVVVDETVAILLMFDFFTNMYMALFYFPAFWWFFADYMLHKDDWDNFTFDVDGEPLFFEFQGDYHIYDLDTLTKFHYLHLAQYFRVANPDTTEAYYLFFMFVTYLKDGLYFFGFPIFQVFLGVESILYFMSVGFVFYYR